MPTLLLLLFIVFLPWPATAADDYAAVQEIFTRRCTLCHQGPQAPAGLVLGSWAELMRGSSRGPVVIPGDPAESELIKRVRGQSQPRMPLTGPPFLDEAEIARLEAWIRAGAGRPASASAGTPRQAPVSVPAQPESLYSRVRTILLRRCARCHAEQGQMGAPPEGFIVNSYRQLLATGERVRVVPGNPAASELLRRVKGLSRPRMPFDGPPWLSDIETRHLEDWILAGAPDESGRPAPVPAGARIRLRGTLQAPQRIDNLAFLIDSGTRIRHQPRTGDRVEVRGVILHDGQVLATRLRRR